MRWPWRHEARGLFFRWRRRRRSRRISCSSSSQTPRPTVGLSWPLQRYSRHLLILTYSQAVGGKWSGVTWRKDTQSTACRRAMGNPRIYWMYSVTVAILIVVRPSSELHELLDAIVNRAISLKAQIKSLLYTEVRNVAPLHVSLSRPLILWTNEKEAFFASFTNAVEALRWHSARIF